MFMKSYSCYNVSKNFFGKEIRVHLKNIFICFITSKKVVIIILVWQKKYVSNLLPFITLKNDGINMIDLN